MTIAAFVDTNYFARFLLNDNDIQSPVTREFFSRVEQGDVTVETSQTVVFELVYVLNKIAGLNRDICAEMISGLLSLDGLLVPNKRQIQSALHVWRTNSPLSFADCCHLIRTQHSAHRRILTFDKSMSNRIPDVVRVESLEIPDQ